MHNLPSQMLFAAVRRRLRLLRFATALRRAAWAATAILIAMALLHMFVARCDVTAVLAATALPWLVAAGWTATHRITPAECAAWADRHLGGTSAYATLLEAGFDQSPASPAVDRLLHWVEAAVPRSQAMLQALPLQMRLGRPVMAMFVSAALTVTLLQLPTRHAAAQWNKSAGSPVAQGERDVRVETAPRDELAAQSTDPAAAAAAQTNQGPKARDDSPTAEPAAANAGADSSGEALAVTTAPAIDTPGSRATAGGREAGDSADTLDDTGFSAAWQGELARTMLSSTTPTVNMPAHADPSRTADYAAALAAPDDSSAVPRHLPAPAVPPQASPRVRLGPAEQAYVRAYFSGSGATP